VHPGVYIQVPFCQSKCTYCHFATGVFPRELMAPYVDALCREILERESLYAAADLAFPDDARIDTVYIGGGTPSLLPPADLAQILNAVRRPGSACGLGGNPLWHEVTLEADPGTVSREKAVAWRDAGFNRVSLGAQSFADSELRAAGRRHREADIYRAVEALRSAAIPSLTLDLILGLAGQTRESWRASLKKLIALRPEHLSLYMLDVDDGSRLGRELLAGGARYDAPQVPSDDALADWYDDACARLSEAGYQHYEISNWALPGQRALHNSKYWLRVPFLGFGSGAHSFNGVERWANAHDPAAYVEALRAGRLPAEQRETVTREMALEEEVFLGLRLLDGINLARLEAEYGVDLRSRVPRLLEAGAVALDGDTLRLLPARLAVSNEVMAELLL
jgi:oxygen-independent coproporphyrinogen-3 oxidase